MRMTFSIVALALFAACAARAELVAAQSVEKEIVVKTKDGKEEVHRVQAERVKPGEEIIYSLRYANDADKPAENVMLVMPVPKEVTYVEGSVRGGGAITFSADQGKTYVARGRLTVTEHGAERPAKNVDITHVRWTFAQPISPGAKGEVSFRGSLK
jgi:uncharacterized repeat protein (TIGR01451 family)